MDNEQIQNTQIQLIQKADQLHNMYKTYESIPGFIVTSILAVIIEKLLQFKLISILATLLVYSIGSLVFLIVYYYRYKKSIKVIKAFNKKHHLVVPPKDELKKML